MNRIVPARWNREFFKRIKFDDMPGHLKSSICGVTFVVRVNFCNRMSLQSNSMSTETVVDGVVVTREDFVSRLVIVLESHFGTQQVNTDVL